MIKVADIIRVTSYDFKPVDSYDTSFKLVIGNFLKLTGGPWDRVLIGDPLDINCLRLVLHEYDI